MASQTSTPPNLALVRSADQLREEMADRFFAYDEIRNLPPGERETLFTILLRAQEGDAETLRDIHKLVYDEIPVPFDEFLHSRRFLGLTDVSAEKERILREFLDPGVRKLFCAAGKGGGKSFMVSVVQAWEIYNLLCLKRPDLFWMLGPGSKIATVNLSSAKEQAKDVVFAEFIGRLEHCPWFYGKYEPQANRCVFPKKVFALSGGSGAVSYYGYNTKMGCVDEASFLLDREGRSVAEELTEALVGSLATRFPNSYKLMVISTLRSEDDYLYQNIERIKEDGRVLVHTEDPALATAR